jgi:hypothetical protein
MTDWKKELIDFKSEIRIVVNLLSNREEKIQKLIDGLEAGSSDPKKESFQSLISDLENKFNISNANLLNEFNSLKQQIEEVRKSQSNLSEEFDVLKKKIEEIKDEHNDRVVKKDLQSSAISFDSEQKTILQEDSGQLPSSLFLQKVVKTYNEHIDSFIQSYQNFADEVDVSLDSIQMLITNTNAPITLSRQPSRGKFWALTDQENNIYLFPNPKQLQLFNEHNLSVVRALFSDSNYHEQYQKMYLNSPATIVFLESQETPTWQLIEKGKISFT